MRIKPFYWSLDAALVLTRWWHPRRLCGQRTARPPSAMVADRSRHRI